MTHFDIRAFMDSEKQLRYDNYKIGIKDPQMTQIEMAKEMIEFEQVHQIEKKAD